MQGIHKKHEVTALANPLDCLALIHPKKTASVTRIKKYFKIHAKNNSVKTILQSQFLNSQS